MATTGTGQRSRHHLVSGALFTQSNSKSSARFTIAIPLPVEFGTFHRNPKRKRGKTLRPRSRFGLRVSSDRKRYTDATAMRDPRSAGTARSEIADSGT